MPEESPAPPPNPELLNRQPKWFKPVFYGAIVAAGLFALCCLLILLYPRFVRSHHGRYDRSETTNNARQIAFALLEFDSDFGQYPDSATVAPVNSKFPTHSFDLSGTSSNALFRQLFAVEITQFEQMYYAKIPEVRRPDGIITSGQALKKGECGFSYISGLSTKDDPATPIVLTPLIPGTTKFDPKPFNGKAIVIHIDYSVRTYDIQKDGHIYDSTGIDLLSPTNPIWNGKAPTIHYPE